MAHLDCINNTVYGWGGGLGRISENEVRNEYAILVVTLKLRHYLGEYT